jgi:hypothetical protein
VNSRWIARVWCVVMGFMCCLTAHSGRTRRPYTRFKISLGRTFIADWVPAIYKCGLTKTSKCEQRLSFTRSTNSNARTRSLLTHRGVIRITGRPTCEYTSNRVRSDWLLGRNTGSFVEHSDRSKSSRQNATSRIKRAVTHAYDTCRLAAESTITGYHENLHFEHCHRY